MDINSKETLHQALDELIEKHTGKPTDIALCEQYRKYDDNSILSRPNFGKYTIQ